MHQTKAWRSGLVVGILEDINQICERGGSDGYFGEHREARIEVRREQWPQLFRVMDDGSQAYLGDHQCYGEAVQSLFSTRISALRRRIYSN